MGDHPHHWMLDEPHGEAVVEARCRHCGRQRFYAASWLGETETEAIERDREARGVLGHEVDAVVRAFYLRVVVDEDE